ncbi:flagellar motor protein MotB [Paenibacillus sp. MMS18-CY102]|uniref:flagellar motor protein MotB n=1 Tax=Paenibacillus sp. MMS18-CY102 TaxID=2682849 RepID=UPI0013664586|nr:flagellar motor protein MotB [Paenibacillus sp. MMS18-CY102]MWC30569.1 OmpA family protein [Paenibacillus sp. MMS18-CY102]
MRRSGRRRGARLTADNQDRWLITYADLITLLMIFFVILYAMSQVDSKKYEVLAQSLQFEFRKADSVIEGGNGVTGALDPSKQPIPAKPPEEKRNAAQEAEQRKLEEEKRKEQELENVYAIIKAYIKDNKLEEKVFVSNEEQGISIRLSDQFLFDLGKANLKKAASPVLDKLSSLFVKLDHPISIEGHTDNLPIQPGGEFRDNWALSAGRSLSVLRYFTEVAKLAPTKFQIAGYGDTRPVVPNTTDANRSRNRRVEITIMRHSTGGSTAKQ